MRVYADETALAAYPGGENVPAANVDTLLRTASRMVDSLLTAHVYDVDTDGLPTDADDIAALSAATCAIVVELDATGALTPGSSSQWQSVGIGSVSLSGRQDAPVSALGLPVPAVALVHLSDVGTVVVWS